MLRSAQNCKKYTFLDNFSTTTQEGNMETRQMTHFFHLLFPIQLFVMFISEFENTQNLFSGVLPFGLIWFAKYLNFWPKATDSDTSSHLDTMRLLKTYIMFCPPAGAKYPFYSIMRKSTMKSNLHHIELLSLIVLLNFKGRNFRDFLMN